MTLLTTLSPRQIAAAERTLSAGTWGITAGAVAYSVLTVTPLVARVTPPGWAWTAPLLPLVVDAAVITSVKLDATVARLGEKAGGWATLLRWMSGAMTLGLNVGDSALNGDTTGVAVHAVIPLILIVIADAGLAWRRAIGRAVERIECSRAAEKSAREQAAEVRERKNREERERREQRERTERLEREERTERLERERRAHEAQQAREARDHTALMAREQAEREAAERQADRHAQTARERREEERREREAREARDQQLAVQAKEAARVRLATEAESAREQHEPPVNTATAAVNTDTAPVFTDDGAVNTEGPSAPVVNTDKPAEDDKLTEEQARAVIAAAVSSGRTIRELADETGWSIGWVSSRRQELAMTKAGG
ncbi:DUF2637 domain-containing protein [Streptomyces sp. NBC_00932]|uniref:DUF2637 domain-containing protein n=1 Tax=Streptomyces sp. NBC_00932 TaxID=2903690 RepID=UPI00386B117C|nr:DUF2637 domain-containing protein [Streptomyces sp. NBC_00932]